MRRDFIGSSTPLIVPLRSTCISFYEDTDPTGRQAADCFTR